MNQIKDQKKEYDELWERVLVDIEPQISKANFTTWFQNTHIDKAKENIIFLNVPNSFTKEWLKNKYNKFIVSAIRRINPSIRAVEYTICAKPANNLNKIVRSRRINVNQLNGEPQLGFDKFNESKDSLNPRYTFDNFVVGSFNELAHAAAVAISKKPGYVYNPFFVYGGVGLGKTHLLQALGNKIKEDNPDAKIKYTTSEKFANGIIYSLQNNKTHEFKEEYKKYDLLIMDDVQFFAGKTKTREEFFHIFNALYEKNKQIVFSSDRPPKSIPDLEERLRSRFEGGMMTDISEPEYESRVAILQSKAKEKNLILSDKVIELVATVVKNNIRELEGALNSLLAQTRLLNKELTPLEVKNILNKNAISGKKKLTFNKIVKTVSDFYETNEERLYEKTRRKEYVLPRQVAMYLLREEFGASYPYIGQKFGGRDHTTVIHAFEKISEDMKNNPQLRVDIQSLKDNLYS